MLIEGQTWKPIDSDGDKVSCSAACGSVSLGTKLPFVSLTTCMVLTGLGPVLLATLGLDPVESGCEREDAHEA